MASNPIYLDHHASTPVDPRVLAVMEPFLCTMCGNPASQHEFGKVARHAVESARESVAALLGATRKEIVFTSGATESNNMAIKGSATASRVGKRRVLVSAVEHKCVLDSAAWMRDAFGIEVEQLPVDGWGIVDLNAARQMIQPDVLVCSVMLANNEVGSIQPVAEIGQICEQNGVLFHVDATQGVGRVPFNVNQCKVDLASLSGHKIYGPKGVGALYIRAGVEVAPLLHGGGQEHGMRSGTLNVPGIVGLGEACRILMAEGPAECARLEALRNRLLLRLHSLLGNRLMVIGPWHKDANVLRRARLPHNLNVLISGSKGSGIVKALGENVCCSSGAACSCNGGKPSHVLLAMGLPTEQANASLRFGIGRFNTPEEVDRAASAVASATNSVR